MWTIINLALLLACLVDCQLLGGDGVETLYSTSAPDTGKNSPTPGRASYNQSCDDGVRCDSRASLVCKDKLCKCLQPDQMSYNSNSNKCLVLPGERCTYTAVTSGDKRWTERFECVENASCNNDAFCSCSTHFYDDLNGSCKPEGHYGSTCTKNKECRQDKNLVCSGGLCKCNETEAVHEPTLNICIGRAGASCQKYAHSCVKHAQCHNLYRFRYGLAQGSNFRKMRQIQSQKHMNCTCTPEFKVSKDGLCLGGHGYVCDNLNPCSDGFICAGGTCACRYPAHQYYNSTSRSCISFIRGPCFEGNGSLQQDSCVQNAMCTNSRGVYECACKPGYSESAGRVCEIGYGQDCSASVKCDQYAGLVCQNGKCACPGLQGYDMENNICRGLIGAVCDTSAFCIDGAYCDRFRDPVRSHTKGVCRCASTHPANKERKCIPLHPEFDGPSIPMIT